MKRFILITFSVLAILAGLSLCQKQDPEEKEIEALKGMLLDENGQIVFDRTLVNGPYEIGVENEEAALELAILYVGESFPGGEYTRTFSGDRGHIQAGPGRANIYYSVQFDVEGIPPFVLNIKDAVSMGAIETGHGGTYHKCNICSFVWRSTSSVCPMTAKHGK